MLFNDLISILKKVKTEKDLNAEVIDDLLHYAAHATSDFITMSQPLVSRLEAIEVARMTALRHFDMLIAEAMIDEAGQ